MVQRDGAGFIATAAVLLAAFEVGQRYSIVAGTGCRDSLACVTVWHFGKTRSNKLVSVTNGEA